MGAQPESLAFRTGKLGGEIAGTAGAGGVLAAPVRAVAPRLAASLASGGMVNNLPMWLRMGGGAAVGGTSAAMIEPTQENVLAGTVLGGAAPAVISGLGAIRDRLDPGRNAIRIIKQVLGNDPAKLATVIAANSAAPNKLASQAAGALPDQLPAYQALLKMAEDSDPLGAAAAQRLRDPRAQIDALTRIAGGATQTEARAAREGAKDTLTQITTPMREAPLAAVNRRGELYSAAGKEAEQLLVPKPTGFNLELPKPLDASGLASKIDALADIPGVRVDKTQSGVLRNVADLVRGEIERGGGVIDANALYGIRKSAINAEVQRLMPNADAKAQAQYAAELLGKLRPVIDDAIEKAGGSGWREYLKTFEQGMGGINQQKLAAQALEMYQKNPKKFIALIGGNDTKAVEKIFGPGSYDIVQQMGQKLAPMRDLADYAVAEAGIKQQAKSGARAASEVLSSAPLSFRIPNMLSRTISVTNQVIKGLESKVNEKTWVALQSAAKSGKSMNDLLTSLPPSERSKVLAFFSKASAKTSGVGGVNMMSEQQ
jgi:hypothetical protein